MKPHALVLVADGAYLDHARSLFVNCAKQGNWQGDFVLICPGGCNTFSIENRGITILRAPEKSWTNRIKFRIFDDWLRVWQFVLYLDCDALVQKNLNTILSVLYDQPDKIFFDGSQKTTIMDDWLHFCKKEGVDPQEQKDTFLRLEQQYSSIIHKRIFVSSAVLFSPQRVPKGTVVCMNDIQDRFCKINPGEYDQQVMNLALYDRLAPLPKWCVTWFAFDEADNPSVVSHYWGMYAPWIEKIEGAGGYYNNPLGKTCYQAYVQHRNAFASVFPKKENT